MRTTLSLFQLKKIALIVIVAGIYSSCSKYPDLDPNDLKLTKTYSAEVAQKWLDLQLNTLRTPTTANPFGRHGHRYFAYCGIALYEAVLPGMPAYKSLTGQLTDMPAMPTTQPGKAYHWPTCANAALAYMNKHFFTASNVSPAVLISLDSLETALNNQYQTEINNAEIFQRSKDFGRIVAEKIFTWSTTDGSDHANDPYTPNGGIGSWKNTAPNPTGIAEPYWGNNRRFVQGVDAGTASPLPPPYSLDTNSAYATMVREVYDVSKTLTAEQKATALFYRDNPGYPQAVNYLSTFSQVMHVENPKLDFYTLAHVKLGLAFAEAMINCWKVKYSVLQERPTRYIRNVLGHTDWSPFIAMPPHPEFPSAHSQMAGAVAYVLTDALGDNYRFTLHTYDYLGMAPRTYNSFNEMAVDVGNARVYGGIHYTYSCVEGRKQGEKIAKNVLNVVKFKK